MEESSKFAFPRTIDRPPLFVIWELDEFAVMVIPLVLSIIMRELLWGLIVGVILMKLYIKFVKKGKPNNYLFHLAWRLGLVKIKGTPPVHIRKFLEFG